MDWIVNQIALPLPALNTPARTAQLLKEGPQCFQPLAMPVDGGGDGDDEQVQQHEQERRGHRRPQRESGREDAALRASMKRGVLLGVLPALFGPAPASDAAAGATGTGHDAAAAGLEASPLSSSSGGGKAERKDGEEEKKAPGAGAAALGEEDGAEGPASSWRGRAEAFREEEEAMWSHLARLNPRERSRLLVLRYQRRLEKLLAMTRVRACVCRCRWSLGLPVLSVFVHVLTHTRPFNHQLINPHRAW